MVATYAGTKGKICRKTVVQWSTDLIDGTMTPKQALVCTAKVKSKSVVPSRSLIVQDDDDYIPLATRTSPTAPCTTRSRA
uniref:Integrase core domain containing protein n=1 Tax=Solanum tuberosum TaxID=4113 RepID=M1D825_SOLTU